MKSIPTLAIFPLLFGCTSLTNDSESQHLDMVAQPAPSHQPSIDTVSTDIESKELPISTKPTLSVAILQADDKWHVWMEGRSGIMHTSLDSTFWLPQGGISLKQNAGQYNQEIDGHTYLTLDKLSTLSITEKMKTATENKTGIKIVLEMTDKGKYITQVKPPTGRSARLSTSNQKPVSSAIFTVENNTSALGKPVPELSTALAKEAKLKGTPNTAKILTSTNPTIEQQRKWEGDIEKLYGKKIVISYGTLINLDGDESDEGFFCAKIPSGPTCFVHDTVQGQERYYFSGFNWKPKESIHLFSTETGTYISHQQQLSKAKVTKVLRFDGSGYSSERL